MTLSLIRSRRESAIKKEGCTAAAVMCSSDKNLMFYFIAGSGKAPVQKIFPENLIMLIPQIFKASISSDGKGNCYFGGNDAEFKILNVIAGIIANNQGNDLDAGWVFLQIEQPPCDSCSRVIGGFKLKFPNFELKVEYTDNIRNLLKNIVAQGKIVDDYDMREKILEIRKMFNVQAKIGS
ncbi:deaminase domain-containing protein [Janthinobacterium lividum]